MVKKIVVVLIGVVVLLGIGKISLAMMCGEHGGSEAHSGHQQTAQAEAADKAIEVGNKNCPVMDGKIDEKTKVAYQYKGKSYNFCCAGCPDEFKKDPERYIEKIKKENAKEEGVRPHHH